MIQVIAGTSDAFVTISETSSSTVSARAASRHSCRMFLACSRAGHGGGQRREFEGAAQRIVLSTGRLSFNRERSWGAWSCHAGRVGSGGGHEYDNL